MANSLTNLNAEYWTDVMQLVRFKESVAIGLANTKYEALLRNGDTWHKPSRGPVKAQAYTKGTDVTVQDITSTDETGTVGTTEIVPIYLDYVDDIQNSYPTQASYARDMMRALNQRLDQTVLAEVLNADSTVDAGDVGGTAGSAASLTISNIYQWFTAAARKLNSLNIPMQGRFAVVGTRVKEILQLYGSSKDTEFAGTIAENGFVARRFDFDILYSNNVYFTATLTMATQPTDGDTVIIGGVTFTFKTTIASAGHVLIGANVDASRVNLTAAVNDSGTVDTTYKQLSDKNRQIINTHNITATNDNSADTMAITGYGDLSTSETLTNTANVWSSQVSNPMFGQRGAIDLVIQKRPNIRVAADPDRLGDNIFGWQLHGKKTFADMTAALVRARVNASTWTSN